jgi:hypothetical protein
VGGDSGPSVFVGSRCRRGIVDFHASLPRAACHASFEYNTVRVEVAHSLDSVADIAERHALTPINFQHPDEDDVNFG